MSTNVADPDIAPPEATIDPGALRDPAAVRREYVARLRRRRKRLMLMGLPFALVALLIAAKFLSMTLIANHTVSSYAEVDYEASLNSAHRQKFLNVVEQWKAPYNTGTVYLQLGLNQEARAELEAALPLASGADQCPVRANLAITIERIGDQAAANGDGAAAVTAYEEGLAVLAQAPAECPESTSGTPIADTQQRLEDKLDPPDGSETQEPPEDPSEAGGADQDAIGELGDQLDENQDDRQEGIDEDSSMGGGSTYTDTPW